MSGKTYTVKQGDTLPSIAASYGFQDWATIWDHPENANLRKWRNPCVLYPGDVVHIQEKREREEACTTEQRHRFHTKRRKVYLVLRLMDPDGKPYEDTEYVLTIGSRVIKDTTDSNGWIETEILPNASEAWLSIDNLSLSLQIGKLDPVEERSGYVARLRNMGYLHVENPDDISLAAAVENFQKDYGLTVDGIMGPNTIAELRKQYGG